VHFTNKSEERLSNFDGKIWTGDDLQPINRLLTH